MTNVTKTRVNLYLDTEKYKQFKLLLIKQDYKSLGAFVRQIIDKMLQDNNVTLPPL